MTSREVIALARRAWDAGYRAGYGNAVHDVEWGEFFDTSPGDGFEVCFLNDLDVATKRVLTQAGLAQPLLDWPGEYDPIALGC